MVKLKEGIVLTPSEREWYELMDAKPRKQCGTVGYYYKRQTKYAPRIYMFIHHENWPDRNRRPMGLHQARPFYTRPMSQEEIEYHHFDSRLCYRQYEDWPNLLADEADSASELEEEQGGLGARVLDDLASFRRIHPLSDDDYRGGLELPPNEIDLGQHGEKVVQLLIKWQRFFQGAQLSKAISGEFQGAKRKPVMMALNYLFNQLDRKTKKPLTAEWIATRLRQSDDRSRRNFVRRAFKTNPLFALVEIRSKYPDYQECQLIGDLKIGKKKQRRKKRKPILDLRRKQMEKLAFGLRFADPKSKEYHRACTQIALLQEAHNERRPILLRVTFEGQTRGYSFGWQTREEVVKSFASQSNSPGMTFEALNKIYDDVTSSRYGY